MNFSGVYRPQCSESDIGELLRTLDIPQPVSITFPQSQGAINQIVILEWPEPNLKAILEARNVVPQTTDSSTSLVLRIASGEMPQIKLEHETATMIWLASHTTIPIPRVLCHDATTANPLQHEYVIMTFSNGIPGSLAYSKLTTKAMDHVLDQLADHMLQLYRRPFDCVAGLKTTANGGTKVVPGPFVEETQWTIPEIEKYWPASTKFEDLTPVRADGFSSFTDYLSAKLQCYITVIAAHPALQSLPYLDHDNIQKLQSFIDYLNQPEKAAIINDTTYILAHRDLHFGQLLLDSDTGHIHAVLDWEFAAVLPAPLWQGSFLWSGDQSVPWSESVREERTRLRLRWEDLVRQKDGGAEMLGQFEWKHPSQEAAWTVVNLMRCVVEVVPRNKQLDDAKRWWGLIVEALESLGISRKSKDL